MRVLLLHFKLLFLNIAIHAGSVHKAKVLRVKRIKKQYAIAL